MPTIFNNFLRDIYYLTPLSFFPNSAILSTNPNPAEPESQFGKENRIGRFPKESRPKG